MAVSSSYDWFSTIDAAEVLEESLSQLGVLGEGESPTNAQTTADLRTFNMMLKAMQNEEIAQHLIRKFYIFLDNEVREYDLSTTAANSAHSAHDFYYDVTAGDYTDGETTLTVDDGTGAATSDTILLISDEETLLDGEIDSGAAESLTVEDLDGDAESGAGYFAYTTKVLRPRDILYINRCTIGSETGKEDSVLEYTSNPITLGTRRDYSELATRDTDGVVSMAWYDNGYSTVGSNIQSATLHVWPEPKAGDFLECWGQFEIDDIDAATDNLYFPSNWYLALAFNLAKWLTPKYGCSEKTYGKIVKLAEEALWLARTHESEKSLQFVPTKRRR